jgi:hypothetical protein
MIKANFPYPPLSALTDEFKEQVGGNMGKYL